MHPDGSIYGMAWAYQKGGVVYRWSKAKGLEIVAKLAADDTPRQFGDPVFDGQGICFPTENGRILRVRPDGKIETLFDTTGNDSVGWPGNLLSDGKGNLYGTAGFNRLVGSNSVFRLSKTGEFKFLTNGKQFEAGNGGGIALDAKGNVIGNDRTRGRDPDSMCFFRVTTNGEATVILLPTK